MLDKQEQNKIERDELGRIKPGYSGNLNGRPKGKTLKEYGRDWFLNMNDEQKMTYLIALEEKRPGFAWAMIEGNPSEDKKISISVPRPILGGITQPPALDAPETSEQVRHAIEGEVLEDTTPNA